MLPFSLLFTFPNKIKSKYLEESRAGSGEGRGSGGRPRTRRPQGPDYPGSRTVCLVRVGLPASLRGLPGRAGPGSERKSGEVHPEPVCAAGIDLKKPFASP